MNTLLFPGEWVGRHEILHHLGSGARVEVYAALGPTGEPCTLEIVTVRPQLTAGVYARLAEEGQTIARIVHPGVVLPEQAGAWDNRVWRSSAWIDGEPLRHRLAAGPPPLEVALAWILHACDAVAEAHRHGVVHQGLTPDTLIVTSDDTVKILGFGLAALRGLGVESTDDQALIAALHRPLEQTFGEPVATGWDVYALGLIGYEILTGIHPMGNQARPEGDVFTWHVTGVPEPLLSRAPGTPPALAALIEQAMEKDSAKRLPTVRALADGARAALEGLRAPTATTGPMAVCPVPASAAPALDSPEAGTATTGPMAACPVPASAAPALDSPEAGTATTGPMAACQVPASAAPVPQVSPPGDGTRSRDGAVEPAARRPSARLGRARRVGLAAGALMLVAAAGWMLFGRGPGSSAAAAGPAASGIAQVQPAASASAPPRAPASAKPTGRPAKAPGSSQRLPAKKKPLGTAG
jgi:serine/threonine-protein kinase